MLYHFQQFGRLLTLFSELVFHVSLTVLHELSVSHLIFSFRWHPPPTFRLRFQVTLLATYKSFEHAFPPWVSNNKINTHKQTNTYTTSRCFTFSAALFSKNLQNGKTKDTHTHKGNYSLVTPLHIQLVSIDYTSGSNLRPSQIQSRASPFSLAVTQGITFVFFSSAY